MAGSSLTFEGTVAKVATKVGSSSSYSQDFGSVDITFSVKAPEAPKRPGIPWDFQARGVSSETWAPRPADEAKAKAYDAAIAKYNHELERYRRRSAAHRGRVIAYAQLVGLASVFGATTLRISVEPSDTDFLPGFELALLPEPDDEDMSPDAVDVGDYDDEEAAVSGEMYEG